MFYAVEQIHHIDDTTHTCKSTIKRFLTFNEAHMYYHSLDADNVELYRVNDDDTVDLLKEASSVEHITPCKRVS